MSMKNFLHNWHPVLLWCGLIFFLSNQPHLPGPEDASLDFLVKKVGHMTVYGILFFLTHRALGKHQKNRVAYSFLFCILYALSDEFHQSFIPGRTPMLRDVGFDTIGMIASLATLRYGKKYAKGSAN